MFVKVKQNFNFNYFENLISSLLIITCTKQKIKNTSRASRKNINLNIHTDGHKSQENIVDREAEQSLELSSESAQENVAGWKAK